MVMLHLTNGMAVIGDDHPIAGDVLHVRTLQYWETPDGTATDMIAELQLYTFENLDIMGEWFDDSYAEKLGEALAYNSQHLEHLKSIQMNECSFGEHGLRSIIEALKASTVFESLQMAGFELGDTGAAIISDWLASTSSLKKLFVQESGIGTMGTIHIANALKANTSLKTLCISSNQIGDTGAYLLLDAMMGMSTKPATSIDPFLRNINNLAKNTVSKFGMQHSEGSGHASLRELYVAECGIGPFGSIGLGLSLVYCKSLEVLHIDANKLGYAGAEAIAKGLSKAKSIKELNLRECDICKSGMRALARAWGMNPALSVAPLDFDPTLPVSDLDFCLQFGTDFDDWEEDEIEIREMAFDYRLRLIRQRQSLLLAFGMGMIKRLGGGSCAQGTSMGSSGEKTCPYHFMCEEVFRMVGDAYEDYSLAPLAAPRRRIIRYCYGYGL